MPPAGRLRFGRVHVAPPVLNDISYTIGKFTQAGKGAVEAASPTLGLFDPSGGSATGFVWTYVSGASPTHWNAASTTMTPVPAGDEQITGAYVFHVVANGPGGESNQATVTINAQADACTIGQTTLNYPEGVFSNGRTAASAYSAGVREMHIATGVTDLSDIVLSNSFTFNTGGAMVKFVYADPARPTYVRCLGIGGNHISVDGLKFLEGAFTTNANVQLSNLEDGEILNCEFLNSEEQFYTNINQFSAILLQGCARILVDNNLFQHCYMFVYIADGDTFTVSNNKGRYFHARPHFFGQTVDGVLEESNVYWAPFRTQDPYDSGTHMDYLMSADASGGNVCKNRTARYNIVLPADTMTSARGWVSGGNGTNAKPGTVIIKSNILCNWGVDIVEFTGFEGASVIEDNCFWMVLTWGPGINTEFGTHRNEFQLDTRCTIGPNGAGNVGAGASLLVKNNVLSKKWEFSAYALTLRGTVITEVGNFEANKTGMFGVPPPGPGMDPYNSLPLTSTGFVTGMDPDPYLRSFTDWADMDVSQWATVRQRAWTAFERTDGKGAVAPGGGGFNP